MQGPRSLTTLCQHKTSLRTHHLPPFRLLCRHLINPSPQHLTGLRQLSQTPFPLPPNVLPPTIPTTLPLSPLVHDTMNPSSTRPPPPSPQTTRDPIIHSVHNRHHLQHSGPQRLHRLQSLNHHPTPHRTPAYLQPTLPHLPSPQPRTLILPFPNPPPPLHNTTPPSHNGPVRSIQTLHSLAMLTLWSQQSIHWNITYPCQLATTSPTSRISPASRSLSDHNWTVIVHASLNGNNIEAASSRT